jgi:hypothetical protein
MHKLLQPDSLQAAASLITTEVVFYKRKLQTKCRALDWQHKVTAQTLQQRRKLPVANYPRKYSMHSYCSPKFSMKLEAQVAYRVAVKVKYYTSLIALDIFTSSCSPSLDLENNSTPASKKIKYREEEMLVDTAARRMSKSESFQLVYTPPTN